MCDYSTDEVGVPPYETFGDRYFIQYLVDIYCESYFITNDGKWIFNFVLKQTAFLANTAFK